MVLSDILLSNQLSVANTIEGHFTDKRACNSGNLLRKLRAFNSRHRESIVSLTLADLLHDLNVEVETVLLISLATAEQLLSHAKLLLLLLLFGTKGGATASSTDKVAD